MSVHQRKTIAPHAAQGRPASTHRSARRLWLAGVIAAAGMLAALAWGAGSVLAFVSQLQGSARIAAHGETTVPISQPGEHVVYYEGPEAGRLTATPPDLQLEVRDPAGDPVPVDQLGMSLHYRLFDRTGEAVARFSATQPGSYHVAAAGSAPPSATLTIATPSPTDVIVHVAGAVGLLLASLAAAVTVATRPGSRQATHRRAASAISRGRR